MPTDTMTAALPVDLYGQRSYEAQQGLLREMKRCWKSAVDYEYQMRAAQHEQMRFRNGEQWREEERQRREALGRPYLTLNTFPQYEHQITNEMRKSMPQIKVLPVDEQADVQTAKILRGIIRHIEQRSHAEMVRQHAFDSAVRIGAGYYRIALDYEDWDSFSREPRLAALRNQFACYLDPACSDPTGRGARWGFVFEHQDRTAFQEEWGVSSATYDSWEGSEGDRWVYKDHVRLAEYFWQERQRVTLVQMDTGQTLLAEPYLLHELPLWQAMGAPTRMLQAFVRRLCTPEPRWEPLLPWMQHMSGTVMQWLDGVDPALVEPYAVKVVDFIRSIRQARPTVYSQVRWMKTNGHQILEESIWPGRHIPLLRVIGEELVIDNHVYRTGMIKNAMDPMRLENYLATMICEHIAQSPVSPYMLTPEQIEGHEAQWQVANQIEQPYLLYNLVKDKMGNVLPLPPPQRNAVEPPIQALTVALTMAQQYTQNAIGVYQRNVGGATERRSGVAIRAEDEQADTGTFHYIYELRNTMGYEGEQLVDLIHNPHIFPPQKVQRILGEDDTPQKVILGQQPPMAPGQQAPPLPEGIAGIYNPSVGRYDTVVTVGPAYATKRAEAAEQLFELARAFPEAMGTVLHKIVGMQDWDGADELVDLLKQLPGQILDEPGNDQRKINAVLRQKLQQAVAQLQSLDQFAKDAQALVQQLSAENQRLKDAHDLKALEVQDAQRDTDLEERKLLHQMAMDRAKLALDRWKAEQAAMAVTPHETNEDAE